MPSLSGIITDIQRFSVHDGPGIRTTIFLRRASCTAPGAITRKRLLRARNSKLSLSGALGAALASPPASMAHAQGTRGRGDHRNAAWPAAPVRGNVLPAP